MPLILLLLAALIIGASLHVRPSRQLVSSPPPYDLQITSNTTATIDSAQLDVFPPSDRSDHYLLKVTVWIHSPDAPYGTNFVAGVSSNVKAIDCHFPNCYEEPHVQTNPESTGTAEISTITTSYTDKSWTQTSTTSVATDWVAIAKVALRAERFAFAQNGAELEAGLPNVYVNSPLALGDPGTVGISYHVPNATAYDWTGGLQPSNVTGSVVSWSEALHSATSSPGPTYTYAEQVSVVNHNAEGSDQEWTFLIGIALGVAGAALIGAVQESFREIPQSDHGASHDHGGHAARARRNGGRVGAEDLPRPETTATERPREDSS